MISKFQPSELMGVRATDKYLKSEHYAPVKEELSRYLRKRIEGFFHEKLSKADLLFLHLNFPDIEEGDVVINEESSIILAFYKNGLLLALHSPEVQPVVKAFNLFDSQGVGTKPFLLNVFLRDLYIFIDTEGFGYKIFVRDKNNVKYDEHLKLLRELPGSFPRTSFSELHNLNVPQDFEGIEVLKEKAISFVPGNLTGNIIRI